MNYRINWDGGVFAVPDCAADSLKLASGKAVKVLLYIMRFKSEEGICEALGITDEDLEDALSYWKSVGVMYSEGGQPAVPAKENVPAAEKAPRALPKAAKAVSADEIAARIGESAEIKTLLESIEGSVARPLTFDDQRTVIWIYDHLGLPPEVILMLVNYCVGIGRANMHYIEKTAVSWADEGIDSSAAADAKILVLQRNNTLSAKCANRMNLNRRLTARENEYVAKWAAAEADIELIMNAYERTVDATGKVSFPYMNKIIAEWISNGVKTSAEADEYSARTAPAPKNTRKPSGQNGSASEGEPSFDLDLIMEHAKNTPLIVHNK
ncbi:MAG: DnaD domain protein [Oscillospiraceae bacterium]|nr:DnaD domain protein [Oscillospiraceae bacterium]